jgi:hypothetical protein
MAVGWGDAMDKRRVSRLRTPRLASSLPPRHCTNPLIRINKVAAATNSRATPTGDKCSIGIKIKEAKGD